METIACENGSHDERADGDMNSSESQLRIMIDTIPALAWCCFTDGRNRIPEQAMASIQRTVTGRGCWLGMATPGPSGGFGKADGDVASYSGRRRTWASRSTSAAL